MSTAFVTLTAPAATAQPTDALGALASEVIVSAQSEFGATLLRRSVPLRHPGELGTIIAHRGDSSSAPENTLPAFAGTTDGRADFVEIDIRLSRDGVPMVIHDKTVDRTTDGTGAVAEFTAAELGGLDAGAWFAQDFAGTAIPTLQNTLAHAASEGSALVIEYKGTWSESDIRKTIQLIDQAGLSGRVFAQSFSKKTVARLAKAEAGFLVGWLTRSLNGDAIATAQKLGAHTVNPARATAASVAHAHRVGLGVFVWTHDDEETWHALTTMGVDGIVTNRPAALRAWMRGYESTHDSGRYGEGPQGEPQGPSSTA